MSIPRRTFIKESVGLGLGAAALSAFAGTAVAQEAGALETANGRTYSVHEADVLVVGGGMAGLNAARVAKNTGASVILVDKAQLGHSGNSGLHWGQTFVTSENADDDGLSAAGFLAVDCMGILDQEQARYVGIAHTKGQPRSAIEQSGHMMQRGDDTKVINIDAPDVAVTHNALYKQTAQMIVRAGVAVYDNTMMIDIIQDENGVAAGVIAINLIDGTAHVFRAKKTILATGGYHWAYGLTAGSPESTGEGHYALLKRGLSFKDMEFPQYDFTAIHPYGSHPDAERDMIDLPSMFPVNGEINHRMANCEGKNFTKHFFDDPTLQSIAAFQGSLICCAKEIYQGKGMPGDGSGLAINFDMRNWLEEPNSQSYPTYKGARAYTERNLGYEYPEFIEVMPNAYSSAGVPQQDPATCESEIPGLYTVFVALSAMSSMWNWGQAFNAALDAAGKAKEMDGLPGFSPEDVQEVLDRAYGLLEADYEDGIPSVEVQRHIQRACYKGQAYLKSEPQMLEMLAELKRIRSEELPKMVCRDKSKTFNRDWRVAMETEGMLACSFATVYAALERKESRSPFFRTDYPRMDNTNFLCYLWTTMDKDWNFTVEKKDIVDTVMPREAIAQLLDDSNDKYDISVPNVYSE